MHDKVQIKRLIKNLLPKTEKFNGLVYRVVAEGLVSNFGLESIIAGRGPKEFQGGRWMAKGICYVLYTSFSANIAIKEIVRKLPSNRKGNERYIIASLNVQLSQMIDLTNRSNLALLKTTIKDLILPHYSLDSPTESFTQMLGRYTYQAGVEGLKVPSAVDSSEPNLVAFSATTPLKNAKIQDWEIFST